MVEVICEEHIVARKHHRCFHCHRSIAPGTKHRKSTLKDDHVYTLRFHPDCEALWDQYFADADLYWADYQYDGYPPIYDDWWESGEFENMCDQYRGLFPHAIARLELTGKRFLPSGFEDR